MKVSNPAADVAPAELITVIFCEKGGKKKPQPGGAGAFVPVDRLCDSRAGRSQCLPLVVLDFGFGRCDRTRRKRPLDLDQGSGRGCGCRRHRIKEGGELLR